MRRSLTALITAGITALSLVTGATAASAAPNATATPSHTLVIDQFATSGPNGRYIQIQNISLATLDLSNFTVDAWTGSVRPISSVPIPWPTTLRPSQVYVLANPDLPSDGRVGICLRNPLGDAVDAVATMPGTPCQQGRPANPQPFGPFAVALTRVCNTGDNLRDFQLLPATKFRPSPITC
ncbi:hypothetical protein [Kutzneria sp. CA-103260]|uniref:hypothetical protein n=1 Tax=Kutzneria sp. CA-103260 TaxID=2802641 RepID=UPI001BA6416B|nr:hypothetical protein [Kutzneria sp. CA-103260]QUQ64195.1 hypothetical protein JJ691_19150 [Kutzneria sp. CA-103260]